MSVKPVSTIPTTNKIWVPLENNPDVMTKLAHNLGLSSTYSFEDVLSLEDPELLSLIHRPCHALLFTLPITKAGEAAYVEDEVPRTRYTGTGRDPVFWTHQTIGNACGLMGLLYCVLNLAPSAINPNSTLANLAEQILPLQPEPRSRAIYDSAELEAAHKAAAQTGDSVAPLAKEWEDDSAFVAFVKGTDGHLYELEGRRKGPMELGKLEEGEDVLSERALELGLKRHVKTEEKAGLGQVRFSLTALVGGEGVSAASLG